MSEIDLADGEFGAEFARTCLAIDRRPHMVITRDLKLAWQCGRSAALLREPMPMRIRKGYIQLDDVYRPGRLTEFLQSRGEEPEKYIVRSKTGPHWAMVFAWKPTRLGDFIFLLCNLSIPHCELRESGIIDDLRLTQAESRVLELFARLCVPRDIAAELDISLSTVRSHMKQIYSKASVQSGIQLHQLVHTYCSA